MVFTERFRNIWSGQQPGAIIHLKQVNDSLPPLYLQAAYLEKLPFEE